MTQSASGRSRRIVVGVDGSPSSVSALRWAISEAELCGDTVEAVAVWEYPLSASEFGWEPGIADKLRRVRASAEEALARAVSDARPPRSAAGIQQRVVEGYAPKVLVAESAEADLLVVGSRGHGTLSDVLLGSVSQHCAHHSRCPLVIIRGQPGT
ncbi:MAG TPA: universal stress protein [Streptosporangiaceae bacterium]|nr:universal stress protein [Streptosporangiaceae bacterium]